MCFYLEQFVVGWLGLELAAVFDSCLELLGLCGGHVGGVCILVLWKKCFVS